MKTLINIMLCALFLLSNQFAFGANLAFSTNDSLSTFAKVNSSLIIIPKPPLENAIEAINYSTQFTAVENFVHVQNKNGIHAIDVFDADGNRVYSFVVNGGQLHTISTTNIPSGNYVMYVKDLKGSIDVIEIKI